ncbi:MAG: STAS domain-containing protein [Sphingobacteriales bacterium]|nr:STAS domain-containing protein [Sphingobacteriales bacterium]
MKFSLDKRESYTIFEVLDAKLDTLAAPDLKTELVLLCNEGISNIILDLRNVEFVDSSGLSAILVGHRTCNNANGSLVLTGLNDNVRRLIQISQLNTILEITPTLSEAKDWIMMNELQRQLAQEDSDAGEEE